MSMTEDVGQIAGDIVKRFFKRHAANDPDANAELASEIARGLEDERRHA